MNDYLEQDKQEKLGAKAASPTPTWAGAGGRDIQRILTGICMY